MSEQPVDEPALFAVKRYEQPSVFAPEHLLREARRQRRIPEAAVPRVVLLDPDGDIVVHLRSLGQARAVASWACYHSRMWATEIGGVPVGVVPYAVGGPYAVLIAEQAFASGCGLLLSITSAGRIADIGVDPPYYLLIERAWRDEGTSLHYLPPSAWSIADAELVEQAERAAFVDEGGDPVPMMIRGASWTTDAPYRETAPAIAAARTAGCLAVEMEAASLYAFARARQRPVLCLAHITNDMAAAGDDFEKGDANGARGALALLTRLLPGLTVS